MSLADRSKAEILMRCRGLEAEQAVQALRLAASDADNGAMRRVIARLEESRDRAWAERDAALVENAALREVAEAARPIAAFVAAERAHPVTTRGLDPVELYGIHGGEGTEPYGASLKWPDIRALADALARAHAVLRPASDEAAR